MATILIQRAVGNGWYQLLELDTEARAIVAAWPKVESSTVPETDRTIGRTIHRPSGLTGDAGKAYRAAFKAWDGRAFNFDRPAPLPEPTVRLREASRIGGHRRPWVARITGAHPTYRFDRSFVPADQVRDGWYDYRLTDGLYEVCNRNSKGDDRRHFLRVEGDTSRVVPAEEVEAAFPAIPAPDQPAIDTDPDRSLWVECLECGAQYPPERGHLVDAGGMGCVRCNH